MNRDDYIKTESADLALYYPRASIQVGEEIKGMKLNTEFITRLNQCDEVVISMFWKPLGDSLLFLSILTAAVDYFQITRANTLPKFVVDSTNIKLLSHLQVLKDATVIDEAARYFQEQYAHGKKVVWITDEDLLPIYKNALFNTEAFKYPSFYEITELATIQYSSRPARYYLTFEQEVGIKLATDPNQSLPDFLFYEDQAKEAALLDKYKVDIRDQYVVLISQAGEIQKRFGSLRYLQLFRNLQKTSPNLKCILIANEKEESPKEWYKLTKEINKGKDITLVQGASLDLLGYLFSRSKYLIGNDTGLSHLAAMSRNMSTNLAPKVFILYSRHDYEKWTTGKANVVPVYTKLAKYLTDNHKSLRRDKIPTKLLDKEQWAFSIKDAEIILTIRNSSLCD